MLPTSVKTNLESNRVGVTAAVLHPAVIGAVLWWVGLAIEYPNELFPPGDGSVLYLANSGIFLAALAAWTVAIVRWRREQIAGPGRVARWGFSVWAAGFGLLVLATLVRDLVTGSTDGALFPIGGLAVILGGVIVSVVAMRAEVPSNWRSAMIQLGLGWVVVFLIPVVLFERVEPVWWTEALLGGLWFVAGVLTAGRNSAGPEALR